MRIDYARRQLTMGARCRVDCRRDAAAGLYRLATVRGVVNGQPATFVVDTGGEVISISQATAGQMRRRALRRIPLKVYGTSGWDKDAFLMPNVDLAVQLDPVSKIPVVVLNLRAPSALLGFQLGGIVGHKFLSKYRVSIDLERSVVGLDARSVPTDFEGARATARGLPPLFQLYPRLQSLRPAACQRRAGALAPFLIGLQHQRRNRNALSIPIDRRRRSR